jgi:hypothetical protein
MEYVVIFCVNLKLFTAISYTLWSFGIFFSFWLSLDQEKSGNPDSIMRPCFLCIASNFSKIKDEREPMRCDK